MVRDNAQHVGVARDQAGQGVGLVQGLQAAVFGLQFGQAVGAFDGQVQHVRLERLGQKVVRTQCHGAQRVGLVVLAREHDDLGGRLEVQDLLEQLEAFGHRVGVRRQAQVHGDHGGLVPAHLQQGALAVAGGDRLKAVQRPLDLLLQGQIVFDDQQRVWHWLTGQPDAEGLNPAGLRTGAAARRSRCLGQRLSRDAAAEFADVLKALVAADAHAAVFGGVEGPKELGANKVFGHADPVSPTSTRPGRCSGPS
jgi:hypothetical protein